MKTRLLALLAAILPLAVACSSVGEFVWADAYKAPSTRVDNEYLIAPGDVVAIKVFGQESMSGRVKVRSDGRISMPLLEDLAVAGMTPAAVGKLVQTQLKAWVKDPIVSVAIEEQRAIQVSVVGEVARPGLFAVQAGQGVLNVLAQAGGLTQFAARDRIFVIRQPLAAEPGKPIRIRFKWESLIHAEGTAAAFQLRDGDVLVAE